MNIFFSRSDKPLEDEDMDERSCSELECASELLELLLEALLTGKDRFSLEKKGMSVEKDLFMAK